MRILVVSQHYWPEPFTLPEICEELVRRGHTVHVITDVPNYPMGETYPEYTHGRNRRETRNGVRITRTFTIPRKHDAVHRLLNYYSYSLSSTWYALHLREEYDVVFTNETSPVMMVRAAIRYAGKHHKQCVMYVMDLWPACLAAGGLSEKSPIYRFFGRVSRRLYNGADKLLITSRMFRDYLMRQHGVPAEKLEYLPQYAPSLFAQLPPSPPKSGFDLVFAGNIGAAQSLETLVSAAALLTDTDVRIHIVGDGSQLEALKQQAKDLPNVIFHGRRPMEEMPSFYAMADAMLVLLSRDPFISLTLPGKVQTYMAAGKPILAAADGEIPIVLREADCGLCVPAEDAQGLADIIRRFIASDRKQRMGSNARRFYEQNFERQHFMDTLEQRLLEAAGKKQ